MTPLENYLVLHRFMCNEFGYPDLRSMLDRLPHDLDLMVYEGTKSEYAKALYIKPVGVPISGELLTEYDTNIVNLSRKLQMTGEQVRIWKPHQYIALLFTEHYLHRFFENAEKFCDDLNSARVSEKRTKFLPEYVPEDLKTVAFQSATGSGKTLIMHAHVLQYQHWLHRAGKRLNNTILLTPNEQMSAQHVRDMWQSGLHARIFSSGAGGDLLSPVEIIDLNKLAEKKGIKRVAVRDFGKNNLVLVDEGHLGATGRVWRDWRENLAVGGFTFEYSATFNQIASKDNLLRDAYGKCLLFDYSYRNFYEDGYGKDYSISNLPLGMEDVNRNMYLLGCLLTFYLQCKIWFDKGAEWTDFNLTKPLWVFLGKTVVGKSKADSETRSDVIYILDFLGWVLAREDEVIAMLTNLMNNESGLKTNSDNDYFSGKFDSLKNTDTVKLYKDICNILFHGSGQLNISYLIAGNGELHLRTSNNPPFGVINIGDSASLYKLLVEKNNEYLVIKREAGFADRLFSLVDREDSTVTIVIGARRFIAGWNSWRVSTMGLMHVGVGEGPEIIQMFGRGVRLKGWNMSLKRHLESGAPQPQHSEELAELETLHIFGLRSNYMQVFRDLLKSEGMSLEEIRLPVTWNFAKRSNLKLIRLKQNLIFERASERPTLPNPGHADQPIVEMNLYSQLQAVTSSTENNTQMRLQSSRKIKPDQIALFDKTRIYESILLRKQRMGWHNLSIPRETIDQLLTDDNWYVLYAPPERIKLERFKDVRVLEDIFINLIAEYANQFWRKQRRHWESDKLEVVTLNEDDPNNIKEYRLSVSSTETKLIHDIQELLQVSHTQVFHNLKLTLIMTQAHAYVPLLHAYKDCKVTIQPVPLNDGEKKVVDDLSKIAQSEFSHIKGKELCLIRNLSRGHGVSFFDDYTYYPDFIVFLNDNNHQHILFLDSKGLVRLGPKEISKIKLHKEIKEIESSIRKTDPNLSLHAYILSVTPIDQIGGPSKSKDRWEQEGVYFLDDPNYMNKVISDALNSA